MTRSFSHYTDGDRVYLIRILKIFLKDQKITACGSPYSLKTRSLLELPQAAIF